MEYYFLILICLACGFAAGRYMKENEHDHQITQLNNQIKWWKDIAEKRAPKATDQPEIFYRDDR